MVDTFQQVSSMVMTLAGAHIMRMGKVREWRLSAASNLYEELTKEETTCEMSRSVAHSLELTLIRADTNHSAWRRSTSCHLQHVSPQSSRTALLPPATATRNRNKFHLLYSLL